MLNSSCLTLSFEVLCRDLTLNDFKEGQVSVSKTWAAFHEGRTTVVELTDSFGNKVDQNGRVFDD